MALWKWLFPSGKKPEDCPFCILGSGSVEGRTPNVLFQVRILRHCCRLTEHFSALLCLISLRDVWRISFREVSEGRKHVMVCSICVFVGMFSYFILFTMSLGVWDSAIIVETNRNSREEARRLRLNPLTNLSLSQLFLCPELRSQGYEQELFMYQGLATWWYFIRGF